MVKFSNGNSHGTFSIQIMCVCNLNLIQWTFIYFYMRWWNKIDDSSNWRNFTSSSIINAVYYTAQMEFLYIFSSSLRVGASERQTKCYTYIIVSIKYLHKFGGHFFPRLFLSALCVCIVSQYRSFTMGPTTKKNTKARKSAIITKQCKHFCWTLYVRMWVCVWTLHVCRCLIARIFPPKKINLYRPRKSLLILLISYTYNQYYYFPLFRLVVPSLYVLYPSHILIFFSFAFAFASAFVVITCCIAVIYVFTFCDQFPR